MPSSALPPDPSAAPRADHVVLDYQTSKLCCGHCGAEEAIVLPVSVTVLVDRTDSFLEQHAGCQPKTAYRPGAVTDPPSSAEEPIKCATFSPEAIPADVRAKMDADRAAATAESAQARRGCVCPPHADAVACIDLRYDGYSPGPNSQLPPERRDECCCVCHADDEEDALIAEEGS